MADDAGNFDQESQGGCTAAPPHRVCQLPHDWRSRQTPGLAFASPRNPTAPQPPQPTCQRVVLGPLAVHLLDLGRPELSLRIAEQGSRFRLSRIAVWQAPNSADTSRRRDSGAATQSLPPRSPLPLLKKVRAAPCGRLRIPTKHPGRRAPRRRPALPPGAPAASSPTPAGPAAAWSARLRKDAIAEGMKECVHTEWCGWLPSPCSKRGSAGTPCRVAACRDTGTQASSVVVSRSRFTAQPTASDLVRNAALQRHTHPPGSTAAGGAWHPARQTRRARWAGSACTAGRGRARQAVMCWGVQVHQKDTT